LNLEIRISLSEKEQKKVFSFLRGLDAEFMVYNAVGDRIYSTYQGDKIDHR